MFDKPAKADGFCFLESEIGIIISGIDHEICPVRISDHGEIGIVGTRKARLAAGEITKAVVKLKCPVENFLGGRILRLTELVSKASVSDCRTESPWFPAWVVVWNVRLASARNCNRLE